MRILIIKLSSLGDLFHALPTVHNIKIELDAEIDWVTNKSYVDLVRHFSDVQNVIAFPRKNFMKNFAGFRAELRRQEYDMIIDLQGLLKSALTARLARGKRRIGPSFHREGSRFFYDSIAGEKDRTRHAVIENLDIVSHLGLKKLPIEFPVSFPPSPYTARAEQLSLLDIDRNTPHPKVAICPSSRWITKNWPVERFAAVARKLYETLNASITILGSPNDIEACRQIEKEVGSSCRNLAGKTSLVEMGSIISGMNLLISNDSGPSHIAAAVGTPALVVFGPTDPKRTGPFGEIHQVLKSSYPCQPCHSRNCQNPDIPCITGVKVYQVVDKATEMLSRQF